MESVKFITHSMGTAFERGMSIVLALYITNYNANAIRDGRPKLTGFEVEFTIDIDPFQDQTLGPDRFAKRNYFMLSDDDPEIDSYWLFDSFIGSPINGSKQIGVDESGHTKMHGHWIGYAPTEQIPFSYRNGFNRSIETGPILYKGPNSFKSRVSAKL